MKTKIIKNGVISIKPEELEARDHKINELEFMVHEFTEKEDKYKAKVQQLYEENVDWAEKSKQIYKEVR